jgi:hypothetical protein
MEIQIFHHATNIIFKKSSKKKTKILQDQIRTLELIPSFNTSQNIMFFKNPHIKNRPIIIIIIK